MVGQVCQGVDRRKRALKYGVGHKWEPLPLDDAPATRPGRSLRLHLLFRSIPLAGGRIERGDGVREKRTFLHLPLTGIALTRIDKPSPMLLAVDHRVVPSRTPDIAAADLFNATLWFVVAGA